MGSPLHITGLAGQVSLSTQGCFSLLLTHVPVMLAWAQSPHLQYRRFAICVCFILNVLYITVISLALLGLL